MRDGDVWLDEILADRYRTHRRFREGGMSRVYDAWDCRLMRRVVVKLVDPERDEPDALPRLRCEALALRLVGRHAGVVELLDWEMLPCGAELIVMEYVDGPALCDRFERYKAPRLSFEETLRIIGMLLESLAAVHAAGILHRDVKPENILLTGGGLKLIDFGLAIPLSAGAPGNTWKRITGPNRCVGTLSFISPERMRRIDDIDVRADLYSVGAMLYEILTGKERLRERTRPIREDSSSSGRQTFLDLEQIFRDPPPFPEPLRSSSPPGLEAVVLRALDKEPDKRFASAEEMRSALRAIQP